MHISILFLFLLFLIAFSAFFAAAEIGVMSLNRYRLRHLVKQKNRQAIRVNQLLMHPDKLLGVVLVGNTLGNIVASMLATLIGQRLDGDRGVLIAAGCLTLFVLVFAEMTPKMLAAIYPQRVAFACARSLKILQWILSPIVKLITFIAHNVLSVFGVSMDKVTKETLSGEELRTVVHEAGSLLPVEHKGMLLGLLDLEQAKVEDIMVPKAEIIGIDLDQPWHQVLSQLELSQHTRLPLYRNTIDHLEGMIHLRRVLNLALENRLTPETLLQSAESTYYIPEATSLNVQILNFQEMKCRSGFVVNEYGDIQGLVTMEDILEEIVGEFTTDIADLNRAITQDTHGSCIIDGSITLRELERMLNWKLPSIGPRTLSGLIIEYLGVIPPAKCCLRIDDYQIEILKVSDHVIKSVRMTQVSAKKHSDS